MKQHLVCLLAVLSCSLAPSWAASTPLVNHGDAWRYHKGTNAPVSNWKTVADASLDATWGTGNGGFGYADNTPETANCATLLSDMKGLYSTFYMRKQFTITNALATNLHAFLRMDYDDGYIAWLDGTYLTNRYVTGAPTEPTNTALANTSHESSAGNSGPMPAETNDLGQASVFLGVGTHTLAVIGLNNGLSSSSDFVLVADLFLDSGPTNQPVSSNTISGTISANTTLYASNNPYTVASSVTVASGITLTIQPGVTLLIPSGVNIIVANGGILLAQGTSNAPILFTRSGASGNWGNITINGAVGSPETRITYARFEYNVSDAGTPAIEVNAGTAFLDHLTFTTTGSPYIHVDGASFTMSDCYFPTPTASFEPCHGTGGVKSGGHGLCIRNFFGAPYGYNDVFDFTGGNRNLGQPIALFINNVFMGSGDDQLDLDGTDAWVEGNIFLHPHKNGSPDSSSGVSGGSDSGNTSEITIIGNIFYDCDQAAMGKEGNFFTFINNTVVHQTHVGGTDTGVGVICVEDGGVPEGAGMYVEGNIIYDAEKLVRNQTNAIVTFTNNSITLLQGASWTGLGGNNTTNDPVFKHVPLLAETYFTNWASAQVMWDWLSLQTNSPARGTGPNGTDQGGVIPFGASVSGAPTGTTRQTNATLVVGINRTGNGIPTGGFPLGSGFVAYKWRLDTNAWSAETPIGTRITLTGLADGPHHVEVSGKNDAGFYQDDPIFGSNAAATLSATWTVLADTDGDGMPDAWEIAHGLNPLVNDAGLDPDNDGMTNLQEYFAGTDPQNKNSYLKVDTELTGGSGFQLTFAAVSNKTYSVLCRDTLATGTWSNLVSFAAAPTNRVQPWTDATATNASHRYYRLVTPSQP